MPAHLKTKGQAKRYAEEHLEELTSAVPSAPKSRSISPTVAELAPKWIELRKKDERKAWSTIKNNETHVNVHIIPDLGHQHVDELDEPTLRAWVRDLRGRTAANTCRKHSQLAGDFPRRRGG